MRTIQSLPCGDESDPQTSCKVIVVGTHADEEDTHQKAKRGEKNKHLYNILLPAPQSRQDNEKDVIFNRLDTKEIIFHVNATSRENEDKKVATNLRKQIIALAPPPQPLPLRWYGLELEIESMASDLERPVLSMDECKEAARKMHFPSDPDSLHKRLDAALRHLDKLNIFLYYPRVLPNVVFSHPSVLLKKVSELVKHSFKLKHHAADCPPVIDGKWIDFCDRGIVTIDHLKEFGSYYRDIFMPEDLFKLFDRLLITAKISDTEHFMPCLLKKKLNDVGPPNQYATPFVVYFPKGHAPCGLFPAVVAHLCSSKNKMGAWKQAAELFRNHITFHIPNVEPDVEVTLNDRLSYFEVHVSIAGPPIIYKRHCPTIHEAVLTGVRYAICVRKFRNVDYKKALLVCTCSVGSVNPHPAVVYTEDNFWSCTVPKSKEWKELENEDLVWFDSAANPSERLHPQG